MTLRDFERRLQKYIPRLYIRESWMADVAAIFVGYQYLVRINKGEQQLYTWRTKPKITMEDMYFHQKHGQQLPLGAKHRGRMQALDMLVNMRWLTTRQAQEIMWGLDD